MAGGRGYRCRAVRPPVQPALSRTQGRAPCGPDRPRAPSRAAERKGGARSLRAFGAEHPAAYSSTTSQSSTIMAQESTACIDARPAVSGIGPRRSQTAARPTVARTAGGSSGAAKHGLGLGHADRSTWRTGRSSAGTIYWRAVRPSRRWADAHGVYRSTARRTARASASKSTSRWMNRLTQILSTLLFARILQRDRCSRCCGCDRILFHQGSPFFFLRCFTGLYQFLL